MIGKYKLFYRIGIQFIARCDFNNFDTEVLQSSHDLKDSLSTYPRECNARLIVSSSLDDTHADSTPTSKDFFGTPGMNPHYKDDLNDVENFVDLFLTDDLLNHIALCTNNRAEQYTMEEDTCDTPHSRATKWKMKDMRCFGGYILLTRIVKKTNLSEYWSIDAVLDTPFFRNSRETGRPQRKGRHSRRSEPSRQSLSALYQMRKIPPNEHRKRAQKKCRNCFRHGLHHDVRWEC